MSKDQHTTAQMRATCCIVVQGGALQPGTMASPALLRTVNRLGAENLDPAALDGYSRYPPVNNQHL